MSKLNRKEFKELLIEWYCPLSNSLLLEASKEEVDEVKDAIDNTGKNGEDEYNKLVDLNKKADQDQYFLKVIVNTYRAGETHSIEDIEAQYENFSNIIKPKWSTGKDAFVDVPGGDRIRLPVPVFDDQELRSITPPEMITTYDKLIKFFDARFSIKRLISIFFIIIYLFY